MADETTPAPKPGYKTSEFAVTAATVIGGLLVSSGALHPNDAANVKAATDALSGASGQGWGGLIMAAFSTAIYIWSRTKVKS